MRAVTLSDETIGALTRPPAAHRIARLDRRAVLALRDAIAALKAGRVGEAEQRVFAASVLAPDHPEVLLWQARIARLLGRAAHAALRDARTGRPDDAETLLECARQALDGGETDAAVGTLEAAVRCAGRDAPLLGLIARFADDQGLHGPALAAADALLGIVRRDAVATLLKARSATALGRADEAAALYRALLDHPTLAARAFWGLTDLKVEALTPPELEALKRLASDPRPAASERALAQYALGVAAERNGDVALALDALTRANALVAAAEPWDGPAFAAEVAAVREAFAPRGAAVAALPPPALDAPGREVIFLVGLPRSGSTLVEQVLAAHPLVEGASELPALQQIIDDESRRRRARFADWARDCDDGAWLELGARYLERTKRWRAGRPIATDKLPENWLYAGALFRMLPNARVIDCRREPIEMLWSCYRQRFAPGRVPWAQSFPSLVEYWREFLDTAAVWQALSPTRYTSVELEALVMSPEREIRALLDFCRLDFNAACLEPHRATRAVRTASAAQVRRPMHLPPRRADAYGALLDPLRAALQRSASPDAGRSGGV